MRNLAVAALFTLTLGFVAAIAWRAEAVPLTIAPVDVAKPIQPAACHGPGENCPPGYHWVCGPEGKRCWCAPC
jgi:hypothetical protein